LVRPVSRPAVLLAVTVQLLARGSAAQDTSRSSTALGLAAVGAFGVHLAGATVERGFKAAEIGGHLDLGHLNSPRVRVTVDVAFLRTWPHREYVVAIDSSFRDVFYDLSGNVGFTVFGRAHRSRVLPYVTAGVGIHVLTSSFGTLAIDRRYNTNNFGLIAAGGVRFRGSARSPTAFFLETRRIQAVAVSRTSLHVGLLRLFGDLR
jgi:hypothetical protein